MSQLARFWSLIVILLAVAILSVVYIVARFEPASYANVITLVQITVTPASTPSPIDTTNISGESFMPLVIWLSVIAFALGILFFAASFTSTWKKPENKTSPEPATEVTNSSDEIS